MARGLWRAAAVRRAGGGLLRRRAHGVSGLPGGPAHAGAGRQPRGRRKPQFLPDGQRRARVLQGRQLDSRGLHLRPRHRREVRFPRQRGAGGGLQHAARLGRRPLRAGNLLSPLRRGGHSALARLHVRLLGLSRPSGQLHGRGGARDALSDPPPAQSRLHGAVVRQQRKPLDLQHDPESPVGHGAELRAAVRPAHRQRDREARRLRELPGNSLLELLALRRRAAQRRDLRRHPPLASVHHEPGHGQTHRAEGVRQSALPLRHRVRLRRPLPEGVHRRVLRRQ